MNEKDLLKSHEKLMYKLLEKPGRYRSTAVGIFKGDQLSKFSPPAKQVPILMGRLFKYLSADNETHPLIKACIFHYELEFIHPFADGNGRMGRLWQQLILMKHSQVFEYVPVESLIFKNQKKYYKALEDADKLGESTPFIEFSLQMIFESLRQYQIEFMPQKLNDKDRIQFALEFFGLKTFSRKEYQSLNKGISTATASRDLATAVANKELVKKGDKSTARYKKAK
jgi:Fic family protein